MNVETKWWLNELMNKMLEAPNSIMKARYAKQIENLKNDLCPCCGADIQPKRVGSRERRSDFN